MDSLPGTFAENRARPRAHRRNPWTDAGVEFCVEGGWSRGPGWLLPPWRIGFAR